MRRVLLFSLCIPTICSIHEVGETDGDSIIVMELVEGKSLRRHERRGGTAPVQSLPMRSGCQCTRRAHDRGIVIEI